MLSFKYIRKVQKMMQQADEGLSHGVQHALDVDHFERVRSLHRVVRAMHDGECPKCHTLHDSRKMLQYDRPQVYCTQCGKTSRENRQKYCGDGSDKDYGHRWEPLRRPENEAILVAHMCPKCGFRITMEESVEVMQAFSAVMDRNLAVFEEWRSNRKRHD